MKLRAGVIAFVLVGILGSVSCSKQEGPVREAVSHKDDYKEAYIYGFPILMNYGVMYEYAIDKNSGQYKAPFNQIFNEARVFTPKDTSIPPTAIHFHNGTCTHEPCIVRAAR